MPRTKKTTAPASPGTEETKTDESKKKKKTPSAYCEFVREHYHSEDILALPVRHRLKELGRRWQEMKKKSQVK